MEPLQGRSRKAFKGSIRLRNEKGSRMKEERKDRLEGSRLVAPSYSVWKVACEAKTLHIPPGECSQRVFTFYLPQTHPFKQPLCSS